MHAKATVDGTVIAETDNFEFVEGNIYFPTSSVKDQSETLTPSSKTSSCPWKGEGHYYDVHVNGKTLSNAAWYYPEPFAKATHIKDHLAFDKSQVHTEKDNGGEEGKHHGLMDKMKHVFKG